MKGIPNTISVLAPNLRGSQQHFDLGLSSLKTLTKLKVYTIKLVNEVAK